jgi:hypothetical protein
MAGREWRDGFLRDRKKGGKEKEEEKRERNAAANYPPGRVAHRGLDGPTVGSVGRSGRRLRSKRYLLFTTTNTRWDGMLALPVACLEI